MEFDVGTHGTHVGTHGTHVHTVQAVSYATQSTRRRTEMKCIWNKPYVRTNVLKLVRPIDAGLRNKLPEMHTLVVTVSKK